MAVVGHTGSVQCSDRITTADNRSSRRILRDGPRDLECPLREAGHFEYAHGPVPDNGAGARNLLGKQLNRFRPNIKRHAVGWNGLSFTDLLDHGVWFRFDRDHMIDRQMKPQILLLRFRQQLRGKVELIGLDQRLADLLSLGLKKGVSHAAANDQRVQLVHQVPNHANLVADFGAAEDSHKRLLRMLQCLAQILQLLFQQESGSGFLHELGDPHG